MSIWNSKNRVISNKRTIVGEDELDDAHTTKIDLNDENEDEAPNHTPNAGQEARPNYSNPPISMPTKDQLSATREQGSEGTQQHVPDSPETAISKEANSFQNGELSERPNHKADSTHNDENVEEADSRADLASNGWTFEPDYSLLKSNHTDLSLPTGADSGDQVTSTTEVPH